MRSIEQTPGYLMNHEVAWHDLECSAYRADLPFWRALCEATGDDSARVLDLGCGTGRVSLDLAERGHRVTALDRDRFLIAALSARAHARKLRLHTTAQDARSFALRAYFDVVIAPMQLVQLLRTRADRCALLGRVRAHMRSGDLFAAALSDLQDEPIGVDYLPPSPDMREIDGWVYSSLPMAIRGLQHGKAVSLDRLRRAISPDGEMLETVSRVRLELISCEDLERDGRAAGLRPVERRAIPATAEHVGSDVVVLEAVDGY